MTWGVAVGPVAHRRTGLLLRVGLVLLPLGGAVPRGGDGSGGFPVVRVVW